MSYEQFDDNSTDIKPMNFPIQKKSNKVGRFFYSVASDDLFKFGVTPIFVSMVLYYFVYWTTYNELWKNKSVYIDGKYWVRAAATKLVRDFNNIICLRNMKKILNGLVNLGFLEVYKDKTGSEKTGYCYRPTDMCKEYLDKNGELSGVLYEASSYFKYKQNLEQQPNNTK